MNDDTLIVVHAYKGDQQQVIDALPKYQHHEAPILILSPEDSKVELDGMDCRWAGKRAYTGMASVQRQKLHLEMLLDYPQRWFLLHDSDSVCLTPQLPRYIYADKTKVYFNGSPTVRFLARHKAPEMEAEIPEVFQPPVWFSREALERMLAVSDKAIEKLPKWANLIDWYFAFMAREAGLKYQSYPDGISRPIWAPYEIARVYAMVRLYDFKFIHSVKDKDVLETLATGRAEFERDPKGRELCRVSW